MCRLAGANLEARARVGEARAFPVHIEPRYSFPTCTVWLGASSARPGEAEVRLETLGRREGVVDGPGAWLRDFE